MNWKPHTIWTGDNLHVMRGMNSASVDLIYLDPPFNSKADYAAPIGSRAAGAAFTDTWSLDDVKAEWIDLLEAREPKLYHAILAGMTASDKAYLVYMAVRLLEMRRLLKFSGSIYLHCDPTMSHYLKLLMDAIFGRRQFRNEITWQRTVSHNTARRYGNVTDTILYYAAGDGETWHQQYQDYGDAQRSRFRHRDDDGRLYKLDDLTAARPGSQSGKFEWRGTMPSATRGWGYTLDQLETWWQEGRIRAKRDGTPRMDGLKTYLDEAKGKPLINVWTDVPRIPNTSAERTGYPTQKPLRLLDRIIMASSNTGDVVFDPFCGCATTLVAAHARGRDWIGIDISKKAVELVAERISDLQGSMFTDYAARRDLPRRTDLGELPRYNCTANRQALYGRQGGDCAGCRSHFEPRHLEVDHIIARSVGGTDHLDNLQLLCGHCNRTKGHRGMEYLRTKLQLAA